MAAAAAAPLAVPSALPGAPLSLSTDGFRELCSFVPSSPLGSRPTPDDSPFFSPLSRYAPTGTCPKGVLLDILGRFMNATEATMKAAALKIVRETAPMGNVYLPQLSKDIERGFPVTIQWPLQAIEIAARRFLLFFFLDVFAYVPDALGSGESTTACMELIARVCPHSIRALLERDPHFGLASPSETDVSVRRTVLRDLYGAITGGDPSALFAYLAEGTLFSFESLAAAHPDVVHRLQLKEDEIKYACSLLKSYANGQPISVDPARSARLVWWKFIAPTQDGGFVLQQRQTDLGRLAFILDRLIGASLPSTNAPSPTMSVYGEGSVLMNAVSGSPMMAFNPGDMSSHLLDELEPRCRFRGNAFSKEVDTDVSGSANLSVFIIRRAHLYTIHRLSEHLRQMYTSAESGAPLYMRYAMTVATHYPAPKLLIEFDPLFASESSSWLQAFICAARPKYGSSFICALRSPIATVAAAAAATAASGAYGVVSELTSTWWRTFTEGLKSTANPVAVRNWLQSRLISPAQVSARAVRLDSVGQWVVRARELRQHDDSRVYVLDGKALTKLGGNWMSGLYMFAQASQSGLAFICSPDPVALLTELMGIVPV